MRAKNSPLGPDGHSGAARIAVFLVALVLGLLLPLLAYQAIFTLAPDWRATMAIAYASLLLGAYLSGSLAPGLAERIGFTTARPTLPVLAASVILAVVWHSYLDPAPFPISTMLQLKQIGLLLITLGVMALAPLLAWLGVKGSRRRRAK